MSEKSNCTKCGACCLHMGSPPFCPISEETGGEVTANGYLLDFEHLPDMPTKLVKEIRDHIQALSEGRDDRGAKELPCSWFDLTTKRCRHYQWRPDVCRLHYCGEKLTLNALEVESFKDLTTLQSLSMVGADVTDAELVHLEGLTTLQSLYLVGAQVTDAGLEHLKGLIQLRTLNLAATQVTDAGLGHLKGLSQLRTLNLAATQVTDAGLKLLEGLNQLRTLDLGRTKVTYAGLEHLQGLPNLRELLLRKAKVTGKGVKKLQQVLPECEIKCSHS